MRYALFGAAIAVALSFVVNPAPAVAAECAANPMAAIKASEMSFRKMKKELKPDAVKGYSKSISMAKKAAKGKKNAEACGSLAEAEGYLGKK